MKNWEIFVFLSLTVILIIIVSILLVIILVGTQNNKNEYVQKAFVLMEAIVCITFPTIALLFIGIGVIASLAEKIAADLVIHAAKNVISGGVSSLIKEENTVIYVVFGLVVSFSFVVGVMTALCVTYYNKAPDFPDKDKYTNWLIASSVLTLIVVALCFIAIGMEAYQQNSKSKSEKKVVLYPMQ